MTNVLHCVKLVRVEDLMTKTWNGTLWMIYTDAVHAAEAIRFARRRPRAEVWLEHDTGHTLIHLEVT